MNMLTIKASQESGVKKFLFSSSACVYPARLQDSNNAILLKEEDAYPADAEDGYGWEKLMFERTLRHFSDRCGIKVYIARFHNIYGPLGTYDGGREKSPAALCRKIAKAKEYDPIEIWGDGFQTRSYCYIDDCVNALYKLMNSDYHEPINIGTDKLVSISELAHIIEKIANKNLGRKYDLSKPQGVKGRNADISKAKDILGWKPNISLQEGLSKTYEWISSQISQS
jgi:nucleoside-diphosphate-sugar epimerase